MRDIWIYRRTVVLQHTMSVTKLKRSLQIFISLNNTQLFSRIYSYFN